MKSKKLIRKLWKLFPLKIAKKYHDHVGVMVNNIKEDININSSDKKVNDSILGKNKCDIEKFKCSMAYKDMLDEFLEQYFSYQMFFL